MTTLFAFVKPTLLTANGSLSFELLFTFAIHRAVLGAAAPEGSIQESLDVTPLFGCQSASCGDTVDPPPTLPRAASYDLRIRRARPRGDALTIFRQLGDPSFRAHALSYFGRTMQILGRYQEAEKVLQASLALTRESGYRFATGLAVDALRQVTYAQGHFEEASVRFTKSANLFRDMGDSHRLSRTLDHQGLKFLALHEADDAQRAFLAALSLADEHGLIPVELHALTGLAVLESCQQASQRTLKLVLSTLQHPVSAQETRNWATQLRQELESSFPKQILK